MRPPPRADDGRTGEATGHRRAAYRQRRQPCRQAGERQRPATDDTERRSVKVQNSNVIFPGVADGTLDKTIYNQLYFGLTIEPP